MKATEIIMIGEIANTLILRQPETYYATALMLRHIDIAVTLLHVDNIVTCHITLRYIEVAGRLRVQAMARVRVTLHGYAAADVAATLRAATLILSGFVTYNRHAFVTPLIDGHLRHYATPRLRR